jgi:hypothetical protein
VMGRMSHRGAEVAETNRAVRSPRIVTNFRPRTLRLSSRTDDRPTASPDVEN